MPSIPVRKYAGWWGNGISIRFGNLQLYLSGYSGDIIAFRELTPERFVHSADIIHEGTPVVCKNIWRDSGVGYHLNCVDRVKKKERLDHDKFNEVLDIALKQNGFYSQLYEGWGDQRYEQHKRDEEYRKKMKLTGHARIVPASIIYPETFEVLEGVAIPARRELIEEEIENTWRSLAHNPPSEIPTRRMLTAEEQSAWNRGERMANRMHRGLVWSSD